MLTFERRDGLGLTRGQPLLVIQLPADIICTVTAFSIYYD